MSPIINPWFPSLEVCATPAAQFLLQILIFGNRNGISTGCKTNKSSVALDPLCSKCHIHGEYPMVCPYLCFLKLSEDDFGFIFLPAWFFNTHNSRIQSLPFHFRNPEGHLGQGLNPRRTQVNIDFAIFKVSSFPQQLDKVSLEIRVTGAPEECLELGNGWEWGLKAVCSSSCVQPLQIPQLRNSQVEKFPRGKIPSCSWVKGAPQGWGKMGEATGSIQTQPAGQPRDFQRFLKSKNKNCFQNGSSWSNVENRSGSPRLYF